MKTLRISSIITLAVVALALFVAAPVAYADSVIVYGTPPENDNTAIDAITDISVAGFYSAPHITAGDTLTGVTIILSGKGTTTFDAYIEAIPFTTPVIVPGTANVSDFYTNATLSLTGVSPTLNLSLSGTDYTPGLILSSYNGLAYYGPKPIVGGAVSETPSDLSDYAISGDLSFVLNGTASSNATDSDITDDYNVTVGGSTYAGATVEVIYDYSGPPVVPEPGTLSLFGTGLLGLAGMLRFKFIKSR